MLVYTSISTVLFTLLLEPRLAVTPARGLAHAEPPRMALPRLGLHQDISGSRAEFHRIVPGSGLHRGRPGPPRRPTNRSRRRS